MVALVDDFSRLEKQALAELPSATEEAALEEWRVKYLGRNGALSGLMRGLGALTAEERPAAGAAANRVKGTLEAAFSEQQRGLHGQERMRALEAERIDVTLP